MEKLKKLKNLKSLILVNNPMSDKEERFDHILKYLTQIEWFNYERADEARSKISKEFAENPNRDKKGGKGGKKVDKK